MPVLAPSSAVPPSSVPPSANRPSTASSPAAALWKAAVAGVAYLVAMLLSYHFGGGYVEEAQIWLATGVSIAVFVVGAPARWIAYAAAIAVASVVGNVVMGSTVGTSLVYAIDELVVAIPTAWLLRRLLGPDVSLDDTRKVLLFVVVGALGSAAWSWVVAIVSYGLLGLPSPASAWRLWIVSTTVGTLIVTPLVLEWSRFRVKRSGGPTTTDFAVGTLLFVLMVAAMVFVFGDDAGRVDGRGTSTLTYLPLPFLVLGGLVWGPRGTTLSTFVTGAIAVILTGLGHGPFAGTEGYLGDGVIEVQGYIATAALMTLMLTALDANRARVLRDAARWRTRYETVIGASDQLLYELDPVTGRIDWAGDTGRLLASDRASVSTLAGYLERVHDDDRERMRTAFDALASGPARTPMTHRFVSASGTVLSLDGEANAIVDFDDSIHRVVGWIRAARPAPVAGASTGALA